MQILTILSALFAAALATPLAQPQSAQDAAWTPNPGTTVDCLGGDKRLGLYVGPQESTVLNAACAEMMPKCAFPEKNKEADLFCTATVDYALDSIKSSVQDCNVQEGTTKLPGFSAKLTVYPPKSPENEAGVFWRASDCYGYFAHMLDKFEGEGGCHTQEGFGLGNITAGTGSSIAGTVFEITVVETP
ncbi:hypothetical protein NX059_012015 [Plenodomus lindquistii]|nr:hypothetical protein NX059_012015 [Plenodomus lindquistii]